MSDGPGTEEHGVGFRPGRASERSGRGRGGAGGLNRGAAALLSQRQRGAGAIAGGGGQADAWDAAAAGSTAAWRPARAGFAVCGPGGASAGRWLAGPSPHNLVSAMAQARPAAQRRPRADWRGAPKLTPLPLLAELHRAEVAIGSRSPGSLRESVLKLWPTPPVVHRWPMQARLPNCLSSPPRQRAKKTPVVTLSYSCLHTHSPPSIIQV